MLEAGLIRPGDYALTGPIKLETADKLTLSEAPLFASNRPIVLYNPHFDGRAQFLAQVRAARCCAGSVPQDAFNLIVAPHVKMFRKACGCEAGASRSAIDAGHPHRHRFRPVHGFQLCLGGVDLRRRCQ